MNTFLKIFQVVIGVEQKLFPVLMHDPKTQAIAGIILTTEEAALAMFQKPSTTPAQEQTQ